MAFFSFPGAAVHVMTVALLQGGPAQGTNKPPGIGWLVFYPVQHLRGLSTEFAVFLSNAMFHLFLQRLLHAG